MTDFSNLGLSPATLEAVAATGYTEATPIQAQAIPVALSGRDVLGIAQTGTGKTAAFTLPMIDRLVAGRSKARMPRSLVVCPTRELADQVSASFERYSKGQKLSWALLIGGVSFGDQEAKLDRGVDVLIATPGRLLDHFERGKLLLTGVQILVVDEADRMLDMGFIPDIERIFKMTPAVKQTLFFSATMPPEITRLTKQFLKDPLRVEVTRPASTADNIAQHLFRVPSADPGVKRLALRSLIGAATIKNGIVFCNRKSEVDIVAKSLKKHGFDAQAIHGDLDQSQRMKTLDSFRKGELQLLVASDVAARGLDIPDTSHVFNYDVPHHADDYVHRIGRTGRAGRSGDAITLVTPADGRNLDKVIRLIGKAPAEMTLDVDWSQAKASEGRRSERPRRPERRDRSYGRPASETSVAAMEPTRPTPRAEAPEAADSAPQAVPAPAAPPQPDQQAADAPRARRPRRERGGRERSSQDRQAQDRPSQDRQPQDRQTQDRQTRDRQPQDRQTRDRQTQDRQPEARAPQERQPREAPPQEAARERQPPRSDTRRNPPPARGRDDDDRRVVGFGSDVPAFLARK
ncbi:MAG TPA: DEAD/DEAH box helicase [Caulobacteraceae bacterium]|jgi:superfamily II DNA/RNA helicase